MTSQTQGAFQLAVLWISLPPRTGLKPLGEAIGLDVRVNIVDRFNSSQDRTSRRVSLPSSQRASLGEVQEREIPLFQDVVYSNPPHSSFVQEILEDSSVL